MSAEAVVVFEPLPPWRDGGTIWFRCFRRSDGWWWWHGVRAEWRPCGRRYHLYCSTDWWYFEGDIESESYTIEGIAVEGALTWWMVKNIIGKHIIGVSRIDYLYRNIDNGLQIQIHCRH